MRFFSFILAFCLLSACNSSQTKNGTQTSGEPINQTSPGEESLILLGKINRHGLQLEGFKDWFGPKYETYTPDPQVITELKPLIKDIDIVVFMGTWCEDSHRDIPDLYRVLDELEYDESRLTMYAVSDDKSEPAGLVKEYHIIQVPTIIFYKNGKEINRIVEYSIRTLEQDMLDILSGKKYKHPYSDF
ncbi:MAG TPA: thioredoxin family protein [Flavobacteriaceae bacterium]|nr:thioredoxin family protein [Flavobacteriaceae bacterium]